MTLTVVGSSSEGNGYVIQNDNEALILECGCSFKSVKKALGYNISKVNGVIVSHEHGDHAKYLGQYERLFPVFAPALGRGEKFAEYGRFKIWPFPVVHDVDCYGFYITHPEMGSLVFATDTQYVRWNFKKLKPNHIMIECNYQVGIFEVHNAKSEHVISGHMSEQAAHEFIRANETEALQNVMLVHLSNANSDWEQVTSNLLKMAEKRYNGFVAYPKLQIDITRKG